MNWDLNSYFPSFDGPEMRRFKQELERDLDAVEQEAASLAPLGQDDNTGDWVAVSSAPRSCWRGFPTWAPTSAA